MGKKDKLNNWKQCWTHGDVIAYALAHGCEEVRNSASHKILRGPNGKTFPVQFNHLAWRMVPGMKSKIKREMMDAGVPIIEE